jgi:hypothetical protein
VAGNRTIVSALALTLIGLAVPAHGRPLKSFTVAEEISLAHFLDPFYSETAIVSPDGRFVALQPAERGLLKKDLIEDEMRVYDMTALMRFVLHPDRSPAPTPVLDLRESTYKEGPIISQIQWLPNSSGLAFLLRTEEGNYQLAMVGLRPGLRQARPRVLSLMGQDVTTFDVRDSTHYAYTVFRPGNDVRPVPERRWTSAVGTGHSLADLLVPSEELANYVGAAHENGLRSILWAAAGGTPHAVISRESGQLIVINPIGRWLALSPNGQMLATAITVPEIPKRWVRQFLPPYPNYQYRMHAGSQNLNGTISAGTLVSEYVLINVRTGAVTSVNGAPTGIGNGWWWELGTPEWSDDGNAVLLPNAYPQPTGASQSVGQPCAAIFYPATDTMQCLKRLKPPHTKKGGPAHGFSFIGPLQFVDHKSTKVMMHFLRDAAQVETPKAVLYVRTPSGRWAVTSGTGASKARRNPLTVYVRQGLNDPPVVVARDLRSEASRVIWNPNHQLTNSALGEATVYQWKDASGRSWTGGLYKPANYVAGQRYPLVIQTHGFPAKEFHPSGMYPTAFAARALAASGMVVLQTPMMSVLDATREGPSNVSGYEAAVSQLASQGLVDPNRVGIIGFSRTVYHVLEALTTSRLPFAAASVTDGVDFGYWQYLAFVDEVQDVEAHDASAVIGAMPFGIGLQMWVKRSPEFNMQKVETPLQVVALGRWSLLYMWEPYAALRFLGKPVDLMLLNSDEHVLSNPAVRMASQGGSVDWFRFWLQGYEDPDPGKASEYRRWEKLCDIQKAQNPSRPTFCVPLRPMALT